MATREISIRVSDRAAQVYEQASHEERRRLDALLRMRLTEAVRSRRSCPTSLTKQRPGA